jgi:hypothetical protein
MASNKTCDICNRPTEFIDAKLLLFPRENGKRTSHSDYTHHADVGPCCSTRILTMFKFQKRTSREEYNERRKGGKKVSA